MTTIHNDPFDTEADELLQWVNVKLLNTGHTRMRNWSIDWSDGLTLCNLINSIRPGTILQNTLKQGTRENRLKAALCSAEVHLGIPDLILPEELTSGVLKKEVLLTYVALLRDVDKAQIYGGSLIFQNHDTRDKNLSLCDSQEKRDVNAGIPYQFNRVLAFGSGLRWGQVGKPCEFILQIQPDANLFDLLVSIDCKPYNHSVSHFRPELRIKPISRRCNLVRYTPTRPGKYTVNVHYQEKHILNSPFHLEIEETVLLDEDNLLDDSYLIDNRIEHSHNLLHRYETQSDSKPRERDLSRQTAQQLTKSFEFSNSYDSRHDSAFVDDDSLQSLSVSSGEFQSGDQDSYEDLSSKYNKPESIANEKPFYNNNNNNNHDHHTTSFSREENLAVKKLLEKDPFYNVGISSNKISTSTQVSNFKIFGKGLHSGEVGCLSEFQVETPIYLHDNGRMQGPLGVSISCPAVSIPVPFVRTRFSPTMLHHHVVYIPTEPGVYELSVTWGDRPICGSPFRLAVSDCVPRSPSLTLTEKTKLPAFRDSDGFDFFLYYNASSNDYAQHQRKDVLSQILKKNSPCNAVYCIPVDIDLTFKERRTLFGVANHNTLPFVFVNNEFFGNYEQLMDMHCTNKFRNSFDDVLRRLQAKMS